MHIIRAGVLYFVLVFGAGFALGVVRLLWIVPRFGTRMAELMEAPIMLVVIVLAARWVARRLPPAWGTRLGMGLLALGLLLAAEVVLVVWLRGLTISEYIATRDPVSGTVYLVMLSLFALMPLIVARK